VPDDRSALHRVLHAWPSYLAYVVIIYLLAIGAGLAAPRFAVSLYCIIAIYLVVPFREVGRLLFWRE
jgi:hypothetical protein